MNLSIFYNVDSIKKNGLLNMWHMVEENVRNST